MPSEKILEQKKQTVETLAEKLQKAQAGVLVDYCGLTVEEDTALRNEFRKAEVEYSVVKNTITRFAAEKAGLEGLDPVLNGPTSLAISFTDPVAPAKIISEFAKKHETVEIKAGFMDGKLLSMDEIKTLANTPSRDTLIAKIMGSLNAPVSNLVRLLDALAKEGDGEMTAAEVAAKNAAPVAEEAPAEAAPAEEAVPAEAPTQEAPVETPAE